MKVNHGNLGPLHVQAMICTSSQPASYHSLC